jgi:hypothetical protein
MLLSIPAATSAPPMSTSRLRLRRVSQPTATITTTSPTTFATAPLTGAANQERMTGPSRM